MSIENWRGVCSAYPLGHRHCVHGHLTDCPTALTCPLLVDEPPRAFVVEAGPTCWIFDDELLSRNHADVLNQGGATVKYTRSVTPQRLNRLLAGLPPFRRTIEDCRVGAPVLFPRCR